MAASPSKVFPLTPVQFHGRPASEEVLLIHVGTAAFSQLQQQLDRLRLCLAQWARSLGKTEIYLATVLSYETMQGIVGYCFYLALWGTLQRAFGWLLLLK